MVTQQLAAHIAQEQGGVSPVVVEGASRPPGGHSANMLVFTAGWTGPGGRVEQQVVVRMAQVGLTLVPPSSYDLMREWRVMEGLLDSPVPVPPLLASDPTGSVVGFPFYVMGHVDGRVAQDHPPYHVSGWMRQATASERAAYWNHGIDALARLHAVDYRQKHGFLARADRGAGGLEQSIQWMNEWYRWVMGSDVHDITAAALAYLNEEMPASPGDSVLWGDARLGNILFADDATVSAVIDWELASLGPGELDLGYWLIMDYLCGPGVFLERLDGLPRRSETIDRYESVLGRPVQDLHYYEVFATLRFATVLLRVEKYFKSIGRLGPDSTYGRNSHAVQLLAELLDRPMPDVSRDILMRQRPDLPDDFDIDAERLAYASMHG